jgi:hypothetical protein
VRIGNKAEAVYGFAPRQTLRDDDVGGRRRVTARRERREEKK